MEKFHFGIFNSNNLTTLQWQKPNNIITLPTMSITSARLWSIRIETDRIEIRICILIWYDYNGYDFCRKYNNLCVPCGHLMRTKLRCIQFPLPFLFISLRYLMVGTLSPKFRVITLILDEMRIFRPSVHSTSSFTWICHNIN